jgi:putative transposase
VWARNCGVYGVRKVWQLLLRDGQTVARYVVARLMAAECLRGVVRGQRCRTTIADTTAENAQDLVQRPFQSEYPSRLWVSDFTDVLTCRGFVYVVFLIDVFSRRIVGWRADTTMRTYLVLDALAQGLYYRLLDGHLIVPRTADRNTSPCGTPVVWRRPALHPPSIAWAMRKVSR